MPAKLATAATGAGGGGEGQPPNSAHTGFSAGLRYELASEEGRALIGSSTFSTMLGIAWILLVIFGPRTETSHLLPPEERPIAVRFEPPPPPPPPAPKAEPEPAPPKPAPGPSVEQKAQAREAKRVAAAAAAFGAAPAPGNGPVGDVSNVLRGVDVHSSGAPTPGGSPTGGKIVLAYGQGGVGVRTPGMTDIGGAGGAGSVGGVGNVAGGGGIGHAAVAVAAPRAVGGGAQAGAGRDVGSLGDAVREHEPQLRFCYQEYGLKANPNLAGRMTLSLTLDAAGTVTQASVADRTWSGVGVDGTESCVLEKARAWRFPSVGSSGAGTFEFGFNFTR